jgi:uncharacterized protein
MKETVVFQVSPEQAKDDVFLRNRIQQELGIQSSDFHFVWRKRSIDARKSVIKVNCSFDVYLKEIPAVEAVFFPKNVEKSKEIAIIGAGPAGLYAALRALELGLKPVLFERGKDVRARRRDLAKLNKESIVDPESNYCFGEGRSRDVFRWEIIYAFKKTW